MLKVKDFSRLNAFQMKAISEFVKGKSDIFVSLPTSCVDTGVDVESGALNACLTSSAPKYCGDVHAKGFPKIQLDDCKKYKW